MTIHFHPKMTQGQAKALAMRLGARTALQNGRTVLLYEPPREKRKVREWIDVAVYQQFIHASNSDQPQPPSAA